MKSTVALLVITILSSARVGEARTLTLAPSSEEEAFRAKNKTVSSLLEPARPIENSEGLRLTLGLTKRPDEPAGFRWVDDTLEWRRHKMRISLPPGNKIGYLGAEEGTIESFTLSFNKKIGRRTILMPFFRQAVPIDDQVMPRGRFNYETQVGFKITIWRR